MSKKELEQKWIVLAMCYNTRILRKIERERERKRGKEGKRIRRRKREREGERGIYTKICAHMCSMSLAYGIRQS